MVEGDEVSISFVDVYESKLVSSYSKNGDNEVFVSEFL